MTSRAPEITRVGRQDRIVAILSSESVRSQEMATLCIAVFDGLFLELIVTGDRQRLTRAMDYFIAIARSSRKDA